MARTSTARDRLVAAAIDLIWRRSYGEVSVDSICEQAGVRKGSFYHFFRSKDDLVLAALEAHWASRRPVLDRLFSPSAPPLERLRGYFANIYERQLEHHERTGQYLGCFFSAVGIECGDQHPEIGRKVQEILASYTRYYESALRDAAAEGSVQVKDVRASARALFAFMEGVLAQARIQDDAAMIRSLAASAFAFLGIELKRGKLVASVRES